jgi:4-hydroxy-2-oxoheptanedioate aldolase
MYGGRQSYGVADYFQKANGQTMVIVLLEEAEALENLDEILKVDNIDVFFIAPSDLAQTMGHIGDYGHPEVQAAIDDAISRIVSAGRTAGTLVNEDNVADYIGKGVRCVMTPVAAWVARGASQFLEKVSSARP